MSATVVPSGTPVALPETSNFSPVLYAVPGVGEVISAFGSMTRTLAF